MKHLEKRQAEMKERNSRKEIPVPEESEPVRSSDSPEVVKLKQHILNLDQQLAAVRAENERLRAQKTIVVEREKSSTDSVREQRHNFFKYSNIRRY